MPTKEEFIHFLDDLQYEVAKIKENINKAKTDLTILENTIDNTKYNVRKQQ